MRHAANSPKMVTSAACRAHSHTHTLTHSPNRSPGATGARSLNNGRTHAHSPNRPPGAPGARLLTNGCAVWVLQVASHTHNNPGGRTHWQVVEWQPQWHTDYGNVPPCFGPLVELRGPPTPAVPPSSPPPRRPPHVAPFYRSGPPFPATGVSTDSAAFGRTTPPLPFFNPPVPSRRDAARSPARHSERYDAHQRYRHEQHALGFREALPPALPMPYPPIVYPPAIGSPPGRQPGAPAAALSPASAGAPPALVLGAAPRASGRVPGATMARSPLSPLSPLAPLRAHATKAGAAGRPRPPSQRGLGSTSAANLLQRGPAASQPSSPVFRRGITLSTSQPNMLERGHSAPGLRAELPDAAGPASAPQPPNMS